MIEDMNGTKVNETSCSVWQFSPFKIQRSDIDHRPPRSHLLWKGTTLSRRNSVDRRSCSKYRLNEENSDALLFVALYDLARMRLFPLWMIWCTFHRLLDPVRPFDRPHIRAATRASHYRTIVDECNSLRDKPDRSTPKTFRRVCRRRCPPGKLCRCLPWSFARGSYDEF